MPRREVTFVVYSPLQLMEAMDAALPLAAWVLLVVDLSCVVVEVHIHHPLGPRACNVGEVAGREESPCVDSC